ncbi:MAG: response regulator [Proteobacteria bacterium]|nr:response regulator [Pseudomonadota bacterium]
MGDEVADLKRQLAAAQKTIEVLMDRVQHDEVISRELKGDASGAIVGLEAILHRRSVALEQSEARYRTLFDRSPDMVLTVDGAGLVTEANARGVEALGDLVRDGIRLDELFDDQHAAAVLHSVLSGPSGGVLGELTLVDGRRVSLTAGQLTALDGLSMVVLRDVTARRALEEELLQSRRLAAVGHLAAGVAHEINNPLAVMRLRLDALEGTELPAVVAKPIQVMDRQLGRIARIVRGLQTFAKTPSVEKSAVQVTSLVEGALEASGAAISGCAVTLDVPADLFAAADRVQIEQVITNLLVNAATAMDGDGEIAISARSGESALQITVEDHGPGISPEIEADLFTPFVSGREEGTGLGLAICWAILEEHGGSITAQNRHQGGACFTLTLPHDDVQIATIPPDIAPAKTTVLNVLVVDDEPEILKLLTAFLAAAGHRGIPVGSAEDALVAIAENPDIDVLVTDIHLPGRSGLDLLHELSDRRHHLASHAIIMSALFHRPEGGTLYLQKPFRRSQFIAALEDVAPQGSSRL